MNLALRLVFFLLVTIASLGGIACRLRRPDTVPSRTIEPQLLAPQLEDPERQVPKIVNAAPIRLLDTEAHGNVGRRVLHQQPDGELTEDSVWRWSAPPEQYLDTVLRLELAANPSVRLVDSGRAPTLAATLLTWDLESRGSTRLVGAVEFQITWTDRVVNTQLVRDSEPVSAEIPGDLAAAAGRLLRRIASKGLSMAASKQ